MGCSNKPSPKPTHSGINIAGQTRAVALPSFKVIIVGDSGTGKTSLLLRLSQGIFVENQVPTLGAGQDHAAVKLEVEGKQVDLLMLDTAGQERFRVITSSFYRGSNGIVYAFDVGDANSFANCEKWVLEASRYVEEDNICQIIVATKCDIGPKRVITQEAAEVCLDGELVINFHQEFAARKNLIYFETSSKEGTGVKDAFVGLSKLMISAYDDKAL